MKKHIPILFIVIAFISGSSRTGQSNNLGTCLESTEGIYFNIAQGLPTNPTPSDDAVAVWLETQLSWTNGTETENVDVYFSSDEILVTNKSLSVKVIDSILVDSYSTDLLVPNTSYFWRVVSKNSDKVETDGPVWMFITADTYVLQVLKGIDEHVNDVELLWQPAGLGTVLFSQTPEFPGSFQVLSGAVYPSYYHENSLSDSNTYYYQVEKTSSVCQAGEMVDVDNIVGAMICIPEGSFTQGSPENEPCRSSDETQFMHTLTRNIAIMETEVTRQMWADLQAVQPTLPIDPSDTVDSPGMSNPVNQLTWYEAVLFANLLSLQNGFERCYYKDPAFTIPVDDTNYSSGDFYCNFEVVGYRLPSEGEWEYSCRAGATGPFSCPEVNYTPENCYYCLLGTHPTLEQYAVYCANENGQTDPVASKLANPWNLFDMHGNIWEWCWDWYDTYPLDSVDYAGPIVGFDRIIRGGFWFDYAQYCRSAVRIYDDPGARLYFTGFRLVRFLCHPFDTPVISDIVDDDVCSQTGITITFIPGSGASSHDLWVDELEVASNITSPFFYNPHDLDIHSYVIRSNEGTCFKDSINFEFTDENNSIPMPIITGPSVNTCPSGTVALTTESGMFNYQWFLDMVPVSGATNEFLNVATTGNYSVYYENEFGCSGSSIEYEVTILEPCCYNAGDSYQIDPIVGTLRYVPAKESSEFLQGSPSTEKCRNTNETQFSHILTRNLAVMETEVTRQMWADLLSVQQGLAPDPSNSSYSPTLSYPVNQVTWYEAVLFANLLSIQCGYECCYYKDTSFTVPVDNTNYTSGDFYCNFDAMGYRLLSEGEWEFSARAGTTTPFSCDESNYSTSTCGSSSCVIGTLPTLEQYSVYCATNSGTLGQPKSKFSNPWNLFDMHGNAGEWCWDWYGVYPDDSTDYTGPTNGSSRIVRGGFFVDYARNCRSAYRGIFNPSNRNTNIGFRLSRSANSYAMVPSISGPKSNTCPAVTVTLTAESGLSNYQWYLNGTPLNGETTDTLIVVVSGDYTVSHWNEHGCSGTSNIFNVSMSNCCPYSGALNSTDGLIGDMRCVRHGSFNQGSYGIEPCRDSDESVFNHTLTRDISVMATEVTRQMWADLQAVQPSLPSDPSDNNYSPGAAYPVNCVSWYEALLFSNLLSIQYGYETCYFKDADFLVSLDATNYMSGEFYCNFDADGYRLLSEGEWEYATRAGTTSPYSCNETNLNSGNCLSCSSSLPVLVTHAIYCANDNGRSEPAGSKLPNPWYLYDVHGNVNEYCWDWYSSFYPPSFQNDYFGPSSGTYKVIRGGSWDWYPSQCRSASRTYCNIDGGNSNVGFRLARTLICDYSPIPTISGPSINTCPEEEVTLTTETNMFNYQWFRDGVTISGETSSSIITNVSGSYTVSYNDASGCIGTSYGHTLTVTPCCAWGEIVSSDPIVGNMRRVCGETFTQGSLPTEPCREQAKELQFEHTLTRNRGVMETEVTRQMWADLLSVQPSLPPDPSNSTYSPGLTYPVNQITWYEAVLYANLLSFQNGFDQCYYKDSSFTIPVDVTNYTSGDFYCDFDAGGYRLLSEGEWEHSARAKTIGPFSCDESNYTSANCYSCTSGTHSTLSQYAIFCENDNNQSEPVGSKLANPWNLFDMHGNLGEWCWDWYLGAYPGDTTDYFGPSSGTTRIIRGGFWYTGSNYLRSASRLNYDPNTRSYYTGFRLTRTVL